VVIAEGRESLENPPAWARKAVGKAGILLVAPRGVGPLSWADPAPYYFQRALPLLGRTVESCQLIDVLGTLRGALASDAHQNWGIAGQGRSGVIGVYAALLEPRVKSVITDHPPLSHRDGPIFLNVLRVLDIPAALGLLNPRTLTITTTRLEAFAFTRTLFHLGGGNLVIKSDF
jgi:hypothetical protein